MKRVAIALGVVALLAGVKAWAGCESVELMEPGTTCGDGVATYTRDDGCSGGVCVNPLDEHCFPVNCHDCNTCTDTGNGGMICTLIACPTVCDEFCVKGVLKKAP